LSGVAGVILAAGRGSRMGVIGELIPKTLLPVANQQLIAHQLKLMSSLGIHEVYIVVGYRSIDVVQAVGDGSQFGVAVHYVEQGTPMGSAHALGRVMPYINSPFLLTLGDYYFAASEPEKLLQRLKNGQTAIAVKREPNRQLIIESCEVRVDANQCVVSIVEKPKMPQTDLKGCGVYALQPEFFDAVARTPRTALRDEYEISNSLAVYMQSGNSIYAEEIIVWDSNFTRPEDVLNANLEWLARNGCDALVAEDAYVEQGVNLSQAVVGSGSRIEGPALINNVVVFPETIVQANASINRALLAPNLYISCVEKK